MLGCARLVKISVRFTLLLSTVALLASVLQAWVSIRSAEEDLRSARERDLMVLGRSLQVAFENALRDKQLEDVEESMARLQAIAPEVDTAVFDTQGRLRAGRWPQAFPAEVADRMHAGSLPTVESVEWLRAEAAPTLMAVLPLRSDDREPLGMMVMVEVVPNFLPALAETRRAALWYVIMVVFGIGVTTLVLGRMSITAPLERLVGTMRRARLRSLDERIYHSQRDEIGELAHEYNAMMDRLRATRLALERQQDQRHELEQQLARLDKLATVGQLAATLAHEIGSPLQVLVGRARALGEGEHSPEKVQHHAQRIAEQGVRITGIVEKLLGYARRRPPSRQAVDVRHAAELVVDLLEHEAARRDIALSLSLASRPTCARADQDQLQQAILNLVRNAFDASPAGTAVAVTVAPVRDDQGREWIDVTVTDHGVGISAENLPQLTEPFFTTRADQNGTGLGLSVVKSIAISHGGTLEFASGAGETRATLRIPRHEGKTP